MSEQRPYKKLVRHLEEALKSEPFRMNLEYGDEGMVEDLLKFIEEADDAELRLKGLMP